MNIYDNYVKDVLESEEYKELHDLYKKKFGYLHHSFIPKDETLKGFKEKVETSIKTGYTVIPDAYHIERALLWLKTKRFEEIENKYRKFGHIPTIQIGGISINDLEELVNECHRQNKDLFPDYFKWDPEVYY